MKHAGKLSNFVEMLAANGSVFTILAISFERYYAICKPLKAGYKCTRLRATVIICFIWLLSCILTSPILIMAKSSQTVYIDGSLVYNCILETDSYWHRMYVIISMFAFFCLPLIVLMLVYWLISRRLIRESVALLGDNTNSAISSNCTTNSSRQINLQDHHDQHQTSAKRASTSTTMTTLTANTPACCSAGSTHQCHCARLPALASHHEQDKYSIIREEQELDCDQQQSGGPKNHFACLMRLKRRPIFRCRSFVSSGHASVSSTTSSSSYSSSSEQFIASPAQRAVDVHCCCCCNARTASPQNNNKQQRTTSNKNNNLANVKLAKSRKTISLDEGFVESCGKLAAGGAHRDSSLEAKQPLSYELLEQQADNPSSSCKATDICKRNKRNESSIVNENKQKQSAFLVVSLLSSRILLAGKGVKRSFFQGTKTSSCSIDDAAAATTLHKRDNNPAVASGDGQHKVKANIVINNREARLASSKRSESSSCTLLANGKQETIRFGTRDEDYVTMLVDCNNVSTQTNSLVGVLSHSRRNASKSRGILRQTSSDIYEKGDDDEEEEEEDDDNCSSPRPFVVAFAKCQPTRAKSEAVESDLESKTLAEQNEHVGSDHQRRGDVLPKLKEKKHIHLDSKENRVNKCSSRLDEPRKEQQNERLEEKALFFSSSTNSSKTILASSHELKPQCSDVVTTIGLVGQSAASELQDSQGPSNKLAHCGDQQLLLANDLHRQHHSLNTDCHRKQTKPSETYTIITKKSAHFDDDETHTGSSDLDKEERQARWNSSSKPERNHSIRTESSMSSSSSSSSSQSGLQLQLESMRHSPISSLDANSSWSSGFIGNYSIDRATGEECLATESMSANELKTRANSIRDKKGFPISNGKPCQRPDDESGQLTNEQASSSRQQVSLAKQENTNLETKSGKRQLRSEDTINSAASLNFEINSAEQSSPSPPMSSRDQHQSTADQLMASSIQQQASMLLDCKDSEPKHLDDDSKLNESLHQAQKRSKDTCKLRIASAPLPSSAADDVFEVRPDLSPSAQSAKFRATCPINELVNNSSTDNQNNNSCHYHQHQQHNHQCHHHHQLHHNHNGSSHKSSHLNFLAMAHNISDSFHFKRTSWRSGSHPIVPTLSKVSSSNALLNSHHKEQLDHMIIIRDISKRQQMDSRRQVVIMLAFVLACFFLLFFPYRVFTIWLIFSTEDQVQSLGMETYYNLTYFSRILIYLHSAINPIAYNLISTKFRRAFMSILLFRGSAARRHFTNDHQHYQYHNTNNSNSNNCHTLNQNSSYRALMNEHSKSIKSNRLQLQGSSQIQVA